MKKFANNILIFAGILVLAYPIIILFSGLLLPQMFKPNVLYTKAWKGHLLTRVSEIPKQQNIDVVILGSSHAYRGFDPRIFEEYGIRMFNLGSSGQTPLTAQPLLQRYLDQLSPKLVIYVTSAGSFYMDGVESSLDIIANDKIDLATVKMALRVNHLKTYNALTYAILLRGLGLDLDIEEEAEVDGERYINGGYVEREEGNKDLTHISPVHWTWNDSQFKAFEENIEFINKRGIKILLIQTPITETYYNAFQNKMEFDSLIKVHGDYYNFNGRVPLIDSLHFYDGHHLNKEGVGLFNRALLEQVDLKSWINE